jgi:hypothetical protein
MKDAAAGHGRPPQTNGSMPQGLNEALGERKGAAHTSLSAEYAFVELVERDVAGSDRGTHHDMECV